MRLARSRLWWVGSVLVLAALVLAAVGWTHRQPGLPGPVSSATLAVPPAARHAVSMARSRPVRLEVPALALSVNLTTLGLNPNGTVQVPTTTNVAGWYRDGPSPGQIGSAVILGHVDSYRGIGAFFYLRTLRAGDRLQVFLADGQHPTFRVTRVATYVKSAFPDQAVYGSHGYSALQLVTCGGVFDHATGSYESNVVVYAVRVGAYASAPRAA